MGLMLRLINDLYSARPKDKQVSLFELPIRRDNRIYASGVTPPPTVRRQLKHRWATVCIKEIKDGGMNEIIKTFMIILYLIFIIGSIRLL